MRMRGGTALLALSGATRSKRYQDTYIHVTLLCACGGGHRIAGFKRRHTLERASLRPHPLVALGHSCACGGGHRFTCVKRRHTLGKVHIYAYAYDMCN
jgi:hypothetical protein